MNAYGINGNLLKLFESHLSDRKQKSGYLKSSSKLCNISAGISQGSVLGPLLFTTYINDIKGKKVSKHKGNWNKEK